MSSISTSPCRPLFCCTPLTFKQTALERTSCLYFPSLITSMRYRSISYLDYPYITRHIGKYQYYSGFHSCIPGIQSVLLIRDTSVVLLRRLPHSFFTKPLVRHWDRRAVCDARGLYSYSVPFFAKIITTASFISDIRKHDTTQPASFHIS